MGCYAAPAVAAIVHYVLRKKNVSWKMSRHHRWLNLLFAGGAIFGIVDHLWNGELLAFSVRDMMLGLMITAVMLVCWGGIVVVDNLSAKATAKERVKA
jgi:uncharacterized membrane protein YoaK (UPF0700 family)